MQKEILLSLITTTYLLADGINLEPILVTATKTETTASSAPGNVSVISKKAVGMLPSTDLKEIVNGLEGISTIQHRGITDVNPVVVLRGIPDQSRTMILLDGIPMNTSYTSSASTAYTLLPEELERIEVIRGPFSSLYGSSAMGGVINYITQIPDKPEYKASLGYGGALKDGDASSNVKKIYVLATDKITDDLKFKISYGALTTDGYASDLVTVTTQPPNTIHGYESQVSPTAGNQYLLGDTGARGLNKYDLSTKLAYTPTAKDTMNATYRHSKYRVNYTDPQSLLINTTGNSVYSYSSGTNRLRESKYLQGESELSSDLYTLNYLHNFADSTFDIRYSLLSVDDWYTAAGTTATRIGGSGTLTPREVKNTMLHTTWQKPIGDSLLLLGAEYKDNKANSESLNLSDWKNEDSSTTQTSASGGKEQIIAGFTEIQSDISDRLSTNIGARFESWKGYHGYVSDMNTSNTTLNQSYSTQHKNNFSPKISLNYQAADATMFKASWGRAFRAPDPVNLYRTYEIAAMNRVYVANPELQPEKSESYDLGIEQKTPQNGLFKAYWFHTEIEDMISTKPPVLISGKYYYERENVGKARSQGYELSYVQPLPYDLMFNTNYTKTYTKILENNLEPALVGKQFAGIPEDMVNVTLTYDNQQFYALMDYHYQSKIFNNSDNSDTVSHVYGSIDPSGIFNAKIGYKLNQHVDLSLSVMNVADKNYYSYEKAEGRAWFIQANFKL